MASVNKVILVGNLGRDPESKVTSSGMTITNFSVATTESRKDKSGQKQQKTEWHSIVIFDKLAEIAAEYLKKGSSVYLEGKIDSNRWQDKEGNERISSQIVCDKMTILSNGDKSNSNDNSPASNNSNQTSNNTYQDNIDDDIPF